MRTTGSWFTVGTGNLAAKFTNARIYRADLDEHMQTTCATDLDIEEKLSLLFDRHDPLSLAN